MDADLATGAIVVAAGAIALRRPRGRATGVLLCATGVAWFAGSAFEALVFLHRGPLVQLLLAYPRARVAGRTRRAIVVAAYVTGIVEPLGASALVTTALCAAVILAAVARWRRAGGTERRGARSAAVAAVVVCGVLVAGAAGVPDAEVLLAYELAVAATAIGLAGDVLLGRWSAGVITGLLLDVGRLEPAAPLADEIGRALGDRSLAIAYRVGDGYVDEAGRAVRLPSSGDSRRAATLISEGGAPVAALVHDPTALADAELARAATGAARLALSNARLQQEVEARIAELAASTWRVVTAADAERHRLEREVRDGAEQRVAAAEAELAGVDPELATAAATARDELRAFAAGLRPRRLERDGLDGALEDLAGRISLPLQLHVPAARFDDIVESTIYFVCSEALANVAKHARATAVRVDVAHRGEGVVAEVADDGTGGADVTRGSGLRGLADRVEALGGTLVVVSPPEGGTVVRAEVPA